MELRSFEKRLAELQNVFNTEAANIAGHNLNDCERCTSCVFCTGCTRCYRLAYCTDCTSSSHLTHCVRCTSCHHTANSFDCTSCTGSAFLILCSDMSECNYCFGCVGLSRKDFHILNEPYDRSTYFEIVTALKKQLSLPV